MSGLRLIAPMTLPCSQVGASFTLAPCNGVHHGADVSLHHLVLVSNPKASSSPSSSSLSYYLLVDHLRTT